MKNMKKSVVDSVITEYADEQKAALRDQKESVALAFILRSIYLYRKVGASASDVNDLIGYTMESYDIKEFSDLDARIIADALINKSY